METTKEKHATFTAGPWGVEEKDLCVKCDCILTAYETDVCMWCEELINDDYDASYELAKEKLNEQ